MWRYLFSTNERYADPLRVIRKIAAIGASTGRAYLKLSTRDDAPRKNAGVEEPVYLRTRQSGRWRIHAESRLFPPDPST